MNLANVMPIAVTALWRNKTRSFLTTLGVIIGVASVISMVAVGEGAKARVSGVFAAMGTNMLVVLSGSTSTGGVSGGFGSLPTLTWDDLKAIRTQAPAVRWAAPAQMTKAHHHGRGPELDDEHHRDVARVLRHPQLGHRQGVALRRLRRRSRAPRSSSSARRSPTSSSAPASIPVGKTVRIRSVPFLVVGLLERKGQSPMGTDYDDAAFIPVSTFQNQIQGGLQKYIAGAVVVSAISAEDTGRAQTEIASLLRDRHHLGRPTTTTSTSAT